MSDHAKYSPRRFHPQAEAALADPVLRQNFRFFAGSWGSGS